MREDICLRGLASRLENGEVVKGSGASEGRFLGPLCAAKFVGAAPTNKIRYKEKKSNCG